MASGKSLIFGESKQVINLHFLLKEAKLFFSTNHPYLQVLDIINIGHLYYYFNAFSMPYYEGQILYKDLIKAIDE